MVETERNVRILPPEGVDAYGAPIICTWAQASHPDEYTVYLNDEKGKAIDLIGNRIVGAIQIELGDGWRVSNRENRLEIFSVPLGSSDHGLISSALETILDIDSTRQQG